MNEQSRHAGVHLIVFNDVIDHELLDKVSKDIEIHLIGRRPGSRSPNPIVKLNRIIRRNKFDAIHCHGEALIRVILFGRKKTSLTIHDVGLSVRELKLFGKLFAISQAVRQDVYERSGLSPQVVYNGINCERIKMRDYSLLSSDQDFRLVQVSRLQHKKKGQHILLEALSVLSRSYGMNNVKVDFIGEGESFDYLSRMAHDMELSERVRFLGLMERDEIYNRLSTYHALMQPSLYEGFGLSVLEGMAAMIPVVVSGQGPKEIIEGGRCGLYFSSGDARDCAEKIRTLITQYDSASLREMVQRARSRVVQDFDIRVTARKYCEGYL